MGYSLRVQALLKQRRIEKNERRAAELAAAETARAAFHRDYLDRERAAAACGVSLHTWKRWMMAGRGPVPLKTGESKQSRTFWHRADVEEFLANPAEYNRRRAVSAGAS